MYVLKYKVGEETIYRVSGTSSPTRVTVDKSDLVGPAKMISAASITKIDKLIKAEEETEPAAEKSALNKEDQMGALKNARKFTERLDKVAVDLETVSPEMALEVDKISDVLEGRRDATTLKYDPDEASYMKGRFNFDVRKREADEPYVDNFNKSDFEQVMDVRKNPVPIKKASAPYRKVVQTQE